MITSAAPPPRTGRIVRVAVAASLAVHLLFVVLAFGAYDVAQRLFAHVPVRQRLPENETVALSTVLHVERRTRPAQTHHSRATAPHARTLPHNHVLAIQPVAAAPRSHIAPKIAATTASARHELAKIVPHATPQPRPTVIATVAPALRSREQKRLALAQPPAKIVAPLQREAPATNSQSGRYSSAQLAQIQSDLAKSIAADRSRENPLSNVTHPVRPATSSRRAAINFSGVAGKLNGFEGLCEPLKWWNAGASVHVYVTCRTTHVDGTVRQEALPWPLTYPARSIVVDADGPELPPGEVPPPEPGWRPDPTQRLDPDVVLYLRKKGYKHLDVTGYHGP